MTSVLLATIRRSPHATSVFLGFATLYTLLAWLVSGGDRWWMLDHVGTFNVFYGDDAYRFFLARSAWLDADLYAYNFMLPGHLLLEGVLVSLAGAELLFVRCLHGLLAALALCLMWSSGRRLDIPAPVMHAGILVMGLMPLYAMVSLSFYGEFWLGFLLCLATLLTLQRRLTALALVAGVLPLVRPEGIFFLGPLWLQAVRERNWKAVAIMPAPGLLYALFLLVWLDNPLNVGAWRFELRNILAKVPLTDWPMLVLADTYSFLLVVPALAGAWLFRPLRQLWPLLLGAAAWVLYLVTLVSLGLSDYEPRYTYSVIPILVLMWTGFLAWVWETARLQPRLTLSSAMLAVFLAVSVATSHLVKMDPIRQQLTQGGAAALIGNVFHGRWERIFQAHGPADLARWRGMAATIEDLLASDAGIDKLVMFKPQLYYHVDPANIPRHVEVGYPAMGYIVFHVLLNGEVFIQHPGGRMFSYLRFGLPRFSAGERRVLYADLMPMPDYPHRWADRDTQLYLFSYRETFEPEVDLSRVSPVTREQLIHELARWTF